MPQLTWLGDAEAKRAARRVPYRLLETQSVHGDPDADNWLIQGDNLEALKSLLPFCAGRVKCIFIDPPYNTKSAFEHYDDNLEHSQWLSMIYPRLELLRDLLAEDGSIWVTIDDNEGHYLKVVMDEVFGRRNFVANIIWEKRTSRENRRVFSFKHDHLFVYAKSKSRFEETRNPLSLNADVLARYKNPDNDPRGSWQSISANAQAGHATPSQFYSLKLPSGRVIDPPKGRCWLYTEERMKQEAEKGNIWFGIDGNNAPRIKKFLGDSEGKGLTPETIWSSAEVGTNDEAKKGLLQLLDDLPVFDNPKPERLLERIIHIATNPGDLVLDSFLGSATTAAVAHKMGRRWIGIEMGEHARTHCLPRLLKVVDGEPGGISKAVDWNGGGGFRFLTLGPPVFEPDGRINPAVRFSTLAGYLWFLETGAPWTTHDATPSPLLGLHDDTAVVLLYNGILGDSRTDGGNVLTSALWRDLEPLAAGRARRWIIYGEAALMPETRRRELNIQFKQIPYDIQMR
ncbi:site-specific DNA-methyltransferase [Allochromatium palmeri]|uniref:site-specific DNA-methyltransferase (adenine-specific) n=1 Tax=Allochromatium palmeri TaxID=231048 RepID=A0A6N8EGE9_9GAMM|nr:site-specific DNA-methyltransferase [Allochromatium palmeri]MTW21919.1 site-specific DNA-methyltransferase [Allochromatium palmeri]